MEMAVYSAGVFLVGVLAGAAALFVFRRKWIAELRAAATKADMACASASLALDKINALTLDDGQKHYRSLVDARYRDAVEAQRQKFESELKERYAEACAKIDFSVVEYKKTITKKRKKATKKAAPPKGVERRSINDPEWEGGE